MSIELYPLNDCAFTITLETVDEETGEKVPLTTGDPTAFLSTSDASDAEPIGDIEGTVTHTTEDGTWLVRFQGADLDPDVLNPASEGATTPGQLFAIVTYATDIRAAVPLTYADARRATVS